MGARAMRAQASETRTDAELAAEAAGGSSDAFGALYRRHADTAWRVAYSVSGNKDDASDAVADAFTRVLQALPAGRLADAALFRSYLLAATRNAAIDSSRRGGRLESTNHMERLDDGGRVATPSERVSENEDASLVAKAFRSLPERWRSVLWLTEVEGIPPKEAAALLGVTPNNAAQLAVRARAGLRERFVQAHLAGAGLSVVSEECRSCLERLGAYVTGRLAPRDLAKVDQHLAGCAECRERHRQLEDVGGTLRRIGVPLPMLLGSVAAAKWKLVSSSSALGGGDVASGATAVSRGASWSADMAAKLHKPLVAASTGLFALGVISASVLGSPRGGLDRPDGVRAPLAQPGPSETPVVPPRVVQLASSPAPLSAFDLVLADGQPSLGELPPTQAGDEGTFVVDAPVSVGPAVVASQPSSDGSAGPGGGGGGPGGDDGGAGGGATFGIAGRAGPAEGGLVVGEECQGGSLMGESMGCEPPAPAAPTAGVTFVADGSGTPADRTVTIGF